MIPKMPLQYLLCLRLSIVLLVCLFGRTYVYMYVCVCVRPSLYLSGSLFVLQIGLKADIFFRSRGTTWPKP